MLPKGPGLRRYDGWEGKVSTKMYYVAQNALGNPAWRRMAFAVWRLAMLCGTGKFRHVIGLCQIS